MQSIALQIANELNVKQGQVDAAISLIDEGATVPFIARYRKEATGSLDDTQLRNLESRLNYLRELEDRRQVILKSIDEQGKLSDGLKNELMSADNKTRLEELYLPYKPKRRTKGQIAIEAGLEPLANGLYNDLNQDPELAAKDFINPDAGIADEKAALDGAKYILMERFAEDANLLQAARNYLWQHAELKSTLVKGKEKEGAKFSDYFEHNEKLKNVPSHRALAMFRGRNESVLSLALVLPEEDSDAGERLIREHIGWHENGKAADVWMRGVVQWTWRIKLMMYMENELLSKIREDAEAEAINVFARNLKDLLMAAPAGAKATLGLDPGLRTGVKVAVVDATGKLLDTNTIYPHAPQNQWDKSVRVIANLVKTHKVELIAIGNGTASRETDKFAADVIKALDGDKPQKIMVSEAGASVYSASEFAAQEFPNLDVSLRGAVSIARRLQDPLAELVKIEPKSIGVGQYQHDVNQSQLARGLDAVVEDCVNAVGVDLNMASSAILSRISGLSKTLAQNIVSYRDQHGKFNNRKQLLEVSRLGPKAFEQAAGFLRITDGDNALDRSAVHPEAYKLVANLAQQLDSPVDALIGNRDKLQAANAATLANDEFGEITIKDILSELEKPGRDPRPEFVTANFKEGVDKLADLKPGMILEGVVTNVTNFGAFVDVGVHQDGLVHVSALSDKFISDPAEVVKAGDIVKVKVLEVDMARNRASFTMRLNDSLPAATSSNNAPSKPARRQSGGNHKPRKEKDVGNSAMGNAFAAAFANAKKGK